MERRVLCQELGTAAGGFGGSGKGRSKYPDCSPVACSSTSEPRQVMRVWPTTREFQGISSLFNNPPPCPPFFPLCAAYGRCWTEASPCCCVRWGPTRPWSTRGWLTVWSRLTLLWGRSRMRGAGSIGKDDIRTEHLWEDEDKVEKNTAGTQGQTVMLSLWTFEVHTSTKWCGRHLQECLMSPLTSQIAGDSREFFFLIPFCSDFFYMLYFMWLFFFLQIKYTDV